MLERKNIFLIARRGHEGLEDQLTELLAFLWQEEPELLGRWLATLSIDVGAEPVVTTQRGVVDGRLDIEVAGDAGVVSSSRSSARQRASSRWGSTSRTRETL